MSTVVIYADKARDFLQLGTLVCGVVVALATTLCFALAENRSHVCWARPAST